MSRVGNWLLRRTPVDHSRLTKSATRAHVKRAAVRLVVFAVLALLVLKLVPGLETAFSSLAHVSWLWVIGAFALETISEMGYVLSWHAIVDPENLLSQKTGRRWSAVDLAWAQLGGGTLVPAGSFGSIGVGAWILHRLGMPAERIAERQLSLSLLNTAIDALTLVVFGLALATGLFARKHDLALTLVPASVAAVGVVAVLWLARHAQGRVAEGRTPRSKRLASLATVSNAVIDVDRFIFHGVRVKSTLGALLYLWFDLLVLFTAFLGIHASHVPDLGIVVMSYIIGALGGSLPFLPAGVGTTGGIGGMLIVYGVEQNSAIAAVVVYQAVALLVPLIGGTIAFLLLRRRLESAPAETEPAAASESFGTGDPAGLAERAAR